MKILYITHRLPYPLYKGGKLRAFHHIKYLSKKHDVISLSFIYDKKQLKYINKLKKYCSVVTVLLPKLRPYLNCFIGIFMNRPLRVSFLRNKEFRRKALNLTRNVDLVIIQTLRMSQYCFNPDKTIIDLVDTPSLWIKRAIQYANLFWKMVWLLEFPSIYFYEKKIHKKFDKVLVSSKMDKRAFGNAIVLKIGIKIKNITRKDPQNNNLLFVGNMGYHPNIDAMNYFIKKILPIIKREINNVKLYIIGINPKKILRFERRKDVIITGFVKNLDEYFLKCSVFVAPLRMGCGFQIKILEALNYGIPVVTTSIANQGIEAKHKNSIFLADNPLDFAKYVIKLLKDKKLRNKISSNGKEIVRKNYSWNKICTQLEKILEEKYYLKF